MKKEDLAVLDLLRNGETASILDHIELLESEEDGPHTYSYQDHEVNSEGNDTYELVVTTNEGVTYSSNVVVTDSPESSKPEEEATNPEDTIQVGTHPEEPAVIKESIELELGKPSEPTEEVSEAEKTETEINEAAEELKPDVLKQKEETIELKSEAEQVGAREGIILYVDAETYEDSVYLFWETEGNFKSFHIYVDGQKVKTLKGNTTEYLIEELQAYTEYDIMVEGITADGNADAYELNVRTAWPTDELLEATIQLIPEDIKRNELSAYSFQLRGVGEGNKDFTLEGGIERRGYLYSYEDFFLLPAGQYELVIYDWENVSRAVTYTLEVTEKNAEITLPIKKADLSPAQAINLKAGDITENSIQVEWDKLNHVESYQLILEENAVTLDGEETKQTFTGLTKDTTYFIDMIVNYKNGLSDYATIILKTDGDDKEEEVIRIPDEALERALQQEVGVTHRALTKADLERLDYLYLNDKQITDLTGLEYAINLRDLSLAGNEITTIDPLKDLHSLIYLDLGDNQIRDLTPIANLSGLADLWINHNPISDLTALTGLTGLEYLYTFNTNVQDISALRNLKKLIVVDLDYTKVKDVSPLLKLPKLEEVFLHQTSVVIDDLVMLTENGVRVHADGYIDLFTASIGKVTDESVEIEWEVFKNLSGKNVKGIEVMLDSDEIYEFDAKSGSYRFTDLEPSMYYFFEFRVVYSDGTEEFFLLEAMTDFPEEAKRNVKVQLKNAPKETVTYHIDTLYSTYGTGKIGSDGYLLDAASGEDILSLGLGVFTVILYDKNGERIDYFVLPVDEAHDYVAIPFVYDFHAASEPVEFKDENLEVAVREMLEINDDRELTSIDMAKLTFLFADGMDIENLSGLEYAKNLYALYLSENEIKDISPLAHLKHLEYLNLDSNNISNVTPLGGLNNLYALSLIENEIKDISPLAHLTNLAYLDLDSNNISNVTPLGGLKNLRYLFISSNPITDISSLAGLSNLVELYIYDLPIDWESTHSLDAIIALLNEGVYVEGDYPEIKLSEDGKENEGNTPDKNKNPLIPVDNKDKNMNKVPSTVNKDKNKKSPIMNRDNIKKELEKVEPVSKVDKKEGQKLPSTATNIYNWFAISLVLLLAGAVLYVVERRKRKI